MAGVAVGRVSVRELEMWKAKAKALDQAVEWLQGRIDCERLLTVQAILISWAKYESSPKQ
jgi:hypothetical protein